MKKTVLITGCSCSTGVHFIQQLVLNNQYSLRCFARKTSNIKLLKDYPIQWFIGDLKEADDHQLNNAIQGIDIVVHIGGIRTALNVIRLMVKYSINKGIFVNTTGIYSKFRSASEEYQQIETNMLRIFQENKIQFVILRPTMIYGDGIDKNVANLVRFIKRCSLIPLFGDGSALIQPIYYKDVSMALVSVMENETCLNKSYNIAGKYPMTYREFIYIIAQKLGKKVFFVRLPISLTTFIVSRMEKLFKHFPITSEQILRTTENRAFDYSEAKKDFGFNPVSFEDGIHYEIEALQNAMLQHHD